MLSELSKGYGSWIDFDVNVNDTAHHDESYSTFNDCDQSHRHGITVTPRSRSSATWVGISPDGQLDIPKTYLTRKGALILFSSHEKPQKESEKTNESFQKKHKKIDVIDVSLKKLKTLERLSLSVLQFGDKLYERETSSISDKDNRFFLSFLRGLNSDHEDTDLHSQPGADVKFYLHDLKRRAGRRKYVRRGSCSPFGVQDAELQEILDHLEKAFPSQAESAVDGQVGDGEDLFYNSSSPSPSGRSTRNRVLSSKKLSDSLKSANYLNRENTDQDINKSCSDSLSPQPELFLRKARSTVWINESSTPLPKPPPRPKSSYHPQSKTTLPYLYKEKTKRASPKNPKPNRLVLGTKKTAWSDDNTDVSINLEPAPSEVSASDADQSLPLSFSQSLSPIQTSDIRPEEAERPKASQAIEEAVSIEEKPEKEPNEQLNQAQTTSVLSSRNTTSPSAEQNQEKEVPTSQQKNESETRADEMSILPNETKTESLPQPKDVQLEAVTIIQPLAPQYNKDELTKSEKGISSLTNEAQNTNESIEEYMKAPILADLELEKKLSVVDVEQEKTPLTSDVETENMSSVNNLELKEKPKDAKVEEDDKLLFSDTKIGQDNIVTDSSGSPPSVDSQQVEPVKQIDNEEKNLLEEGNEISPEDLMWPVEEPSVTNEHTNDAEEDLTAELNLQTRKEEQEEIKEDIPKAIEEDEEEYVIERSLGPKRREQPKEKEKTLTELEEEMNAELKFEEDDLAFSERVLKEQEEKAQRSARMQREKELAEQELKRIEEEERRAKEEAETKRKAAEDRIKQRAEEVKKQKDEKLENVEALPPDETIKEKKSKKKSKKKTETDEKQYVNALDISSVNVDNTENLGITKNLQVSPRPVAVEEKKAAVPEHLKEMFERKTENDYKEELEDGIGKMRSAVDEALGGPSLTLPQDAEGFSVEDFELAQQELKERIQKAQENIEDIAEPKSDKDIEAKNQLNKKVEAKKPADKKKAAGKRGSPRKKKSPEEEMKEAKAKERQAQKEQQKLEKQKKLQEIKDLQSKIVMKEGERKAKEEEAKRKAEELAEKMEMIKQEEEELERAEQDAREQLAAVRKAQREQREARRKAELERKKQEALARREKEKAMMEAARKKEQEMLERISDAEMVRALREEADAKREEEDMRATEELEAELKRQQIAAEEEEEKLRDLERQAEEEAFQKLIEEREAAEEKRWELEKQERLMKEEEEKHRQVLLEEELRLQEERKIREEEEEKRRNEERERLSELQRLEEEAREKMRAELEKRRSVAVERRKKNLETRANLDSMRQNQAVTDPWTFSYFIKWPRESYMRPMGQDPKQKPGFRPKKPPKPTNDKEVTTEQPT